MSVSIRAHPSMPLSLQGMACRSHAMYLPLLRPPPPPSPQLEASNVTVGEYLYVFRSQALTLLEPDWDLRYFVLNGQTLMQYKSAKDLVYNPQEEISIMVGGGPGV